MPIAPLFEFQVPAGDAASAVFENGQALAVVSTGREKLVPRRALQRRRTNVPLANAAGIVGVIFYCKSQEKSLVQMKRERMSARAQNKEDLERERRDALLRLKDEIHKRRSDFELEGKKTRIELQNNNVRRLLGAYKNVKKFSAHQPTD